MHMYNITCTDRMVLLFVFECVAVPCRPSLVNKSVSTNIYMANSCQWRRQKILPAGALPGHYNL